MLISIIVILSLSYISVVVYLYLKTEMPDLPDMPDWEKECWK